MRHRILLIDGVGRAPCYTELQAAVDAEWLPELTPAVERNAATTVDLAVVSQENNSKTSLALSRLIERGVPTLCMMDGISEWRFIWTGPGELSPPPYQPVLSHKVACIGRSQRRLFESWGNLGKCEVVGMPRLDPLLGRQPRRRKPGEPARLLITTAKTPAFTAGQFRRVVLYRDTILHDALECRTPAMPRLIRLIEEMNRAGRECRASGRPLVFPGRILPDEQGGHHLPEERFDLATLYPDQAVFAAMDRTALQAEGGHLRFQHREDVQEIAVLRQRLAAGRMVRLRASLRTVRPFRGLGRLFAGRRRGPASRQRPSWTVQAGGTTESPSARAEREGPDA